jgi:hypothetical protein
VIQERGSLAAGYAAYIEQGAASGVLPDPRAGALARLEGAVAQIRRLPRGEPVSADSLAHAAALPHRLVLTPKAAVVTVPAGTFDLLAAITAAIADDGRDPVAQVIEPSKALARALADRGGPARSRVTSPAADRIEHLLVEAPPPLDPQADARVSPVTAELAGLLRAAAPPGAEIHTLMATAQALGAEPGEEEALIVDLERQGLLVPAP